METTIELFMCGFSQRVRKNCFSNDVLTARTHGQGFGISLVPATYLLVILPLSQPGSFIWCWQNFLKLQCLILHAISTFQIGTDYRYCICLFIARLSNLIQVSPARGTFITELGHWRSVGTNQEWICNELIVPYRSLAMQNFCRPGILSVRRSANELKFHFLSPHFGVQSKSFPY